MVMRLRVKFYIFKLFVFPFYRVDEKFVSNQSTESRRAREREREKDGVGRSNVDVFPCIDRKRRNLLAAVSILVNFQPGEIERS